MSDLSLDEVIALAQQQWDQEALEIAAEHGISEHAAACIWYLRTRSRWSLEGEEELVRMDKAGEPMPNMSEWP